MNRSCSFPTNLTRLKEPSGLNIATQFMRYSHQGIPPPQPTPSSSSHSSSLKTLCLYHKYKHSPISYRHPLQSYYIASITDCQQTRQNKLLKPRCTKSFDRIKLTIITINKFPERSLHNSSQSNKT